MRANLVVFLLVCALLGSLMFLLDGWSSQQCPRGELRMRTLYGNWHCVDAKYVR